MQEHLPAEGLTGFLQKGLRATNPAHQPKSAPEKAKNGAKTSPQRGPWGVLGHPGSTWGAPERCRGRLRRPRWQERATWANLVPTWVQNGVHMSPKGANQGVLRASESDFWQVKSKNCVLLQTHVFHGKTAILESGFSVGSLLEHCWPT